MFYSIEVGWMIKLKKKKQDPSEVLPVRLTSELKTRILKIRGWKDAPCTLKQKETGVAILTTSKVDFKIKQ